MGIFTVKPNCWKAVRVYRGKMRSLMIPLHTRFCLEYHFGIETLGFGKNSGVFAFETKEAAEEYATRVGKSFARVYRAIGRGKMTLPAEILYCDELDDFFKDYWEAGNGVVPSYHVQKHPKGTVLYRSIELVEE